MYFEFGNLVSYLETQRGQWYAGLLGSSRSEKCMQDFDFRDLCYIIKST